MDPLLLRPPAAVPAGGLSLLSNAPVDCCRPESRSSRAHRAVPRACAVTLGCITSSSAPGAPLVSGRAADRSAGRYAGRYAWRPHPEWGSRNPRSISLILVITGVEAGDNCRRRRSSRQSTCWPSVGGRGRACCRLVDISTAVHRSSPSSTRCPRSVPALPPARPQGGSVAVIRAGQRRVPRQLPKGGGMWLCTTRSSPTCAHSWGQLLYLSTGEWPVTCRRGLFQAPSARGRRPRPVDK